MSRISLTLLSLFVGAPVAASAEPLALLIAPDPMTKYEAFASVVVKRCTRPADAREIMVCGRRNADRYRVPFTGYAVGDPRSETLAGERVRLQHQTTTCQDLGPFQIKCGMVGVHTSVGFGEGGLTLRTPAD
jgi:hypothetical protein